MSEGAKERDAAEIAAERRAQIKQWIGQAEKLEATGEPAKVIAANNLRLRAVCLNLGLRSD
jgi:hypothetical protein